MALVRFDSESFIKSLEPGLCTFVMQQFQDKLESKLNKIVDEVYAELEQEMPSQIKATVLSAFSMYDSETKVNVEVDIKQPSKPLIQR